MNIIETDVLIVGGGPAGASAALGLLNQSDIRVTLVEQSAFDQLKIGEHVSPSIFDFIRYLKLEKEDFEADSFIPSYGTLSYWGSEHPSSRDSIFTTENGNYQLDREKFDLALIQKVAERGGQVYPRTKCTHFVQKKNKEWEVNLSHPTQGNFLVSTNFLIDATGRKANVCRQLKVSSKKVDNLIGVGAFLSFKAPKKLDHHLLIEATEKGWWYSAVLPNDLITAIFFSDADIISKHQLNKQANWNALLLETKQMKHRLNGAYSSDPNPWVRNAFTQITNVADCDNFLAIGDAATSFDPISSMGIGFAMSSACQAAAIVHAQLSKPDQNKIKDYQRDLYNNFENYLRLREMFYGKEKRWPSSDFWSRRVKMPTNTFLEHTV